MAIATILPVSAASSSAAQLISPGKLSSAHAELEGVRSCTDCHELRKPGSSNEKCLACHDPLAARVAAGRGYHGRLAPQSCAQCHKEHLGREFEMVRMDPQTFDHAATGFKLEPGHAKAECRACHKPDRIEAADVKEWVRAHGKGEATYLGATKSCTGCHRTDDPHQGQFPRRACEDCHTAGDWEKPVRFDHARTSYALTGRHRQVSCDGCHRAERANGQEFVRYKGVNSGNCSSCHNDPHAGAMGATCASCHDTGGWRRVSRNAVEDRFDHSRTRFPLRGKHSDVGCADCHGAANRRAEGLLIRYARGSENATFPRPLHNACTACHLDYHGGDFAQSGSGLQCSGCHGENGWTPATFDIDRHSRASFKLTGAHIAVACTACHTPRPGTGRAAFRLADPSCVACHREDNPHGERFGQRPCESCHETASFQVGSFDHNQAGGESCASCHRADDPHRDQFGGTSCDACHDTRSYHITKYDHAKTRFVLDGAHARTPCSGCHRQEQAQGKAYVRYKPLRTECVACHGGVQ